MSPKKAFIYILFLSSFLMSCTDEDRLKTSCDSDLQDIVTDQTGRIYKWTNSDPNFYYIGSALPEINGGFISCEDLSVEFRNEGMLVKYSGIYKGPAFCDEGCDPLFYFIILTNIQKLSTN